jgi:hypothetical protein
MSNIVITVLPTTGPIKISDIRTLDSNVIHMNGNENISGTKTFNTIYVNKIYTIDGNTLSRQLEINNYNKNTSELINYILKISNINTYINVPLSSIIQSNILNNEFVINDIENNKLNLIIVGGYYVTINMSFSIDSVGISTIYFSLDSISEKKRITVNITNYVYSISLSEFVNATVNPTQILLFISSNSIMNINIINMSIHIMKNY